MRELIDDIQPTQYNGVCQNCAEKDQRIKELESQLNITKLKLHESKQDFEKLKQAYVILKNKNHP